MSTLDSYISDKIQFTVNKAYVLCLITFLGGWYDKWLIKIRISLNMMLYLVAVLSDNNYIN